MDLDEDEPISLPWQSSPVTSQVQWRWTPAECDERAIAFNNTISRCNKPKSSSSKAPPKSNIFDSPPQDKPRTRTANLPPPSRSSKPAKSTKLSEADLKILSCMRAANEHVAKGVHARLKADMKASSSKEFRTMPDASGSRIKSSTSRARGEMVRQASAPPLQHLRADSPKPSSSNGFTWTSSAPQAESNVLFNPIAAGKTQTPRPPTSALMARPASHPRSSEAVSFDVNMTDIFSISPNSDTSMANVSISEPTVDANMSFLQSTPDRATHAAYTSTPARFNSPTDLSKKAKAQEAPAVCTQPSSEVESVHTHSQTTPTSWAPSPSQTRARPPALGMSSASRATYNARPVVQAASAGAYSGRTKFKTPFASKPAAVAYNKPNALAKSKPVAISPSSSNNRTRAMDVIDLTLDEGPPPRLLPTPDSTPTSTPKQPRTATSPPPRYASSMPVDVQAEDPDTSYEFDSFSDIDAAELDKVLSHC